jgi:hypothetical protein
VLESIKNRNPGIVILVDNCAWNETLFPIVLIPSDSQINNWPNLSLVFESSYTEIFRVSYFSSKGVSYQNRMKPEIVVPGEDIWSAKAGNPEVIQPRPSTLDSIIKLQGTSMATPAASGLALLILDYFKQKKYFNLQPNISGFLLRSILINSAESSSNSPQCEFGYGIPNLLTTLPFEGNSPFGFRIVDYQPIKHLKHQIIKIETTSNNSDLKITLCWNDIPIESQIYVIFFD